MSSRSASPIRWSRSLFCVVSLLLTTAVFVFLGWTHILWLGAVLDLTLILLVYPYLPKQANPNHRVPLVGSRFSPVE